MSNKKEMEKQIKKSNCHCWGRINRRFPGYSPARKKLCYKPWGGRDAHAKKAVELTW
jgi:hypothetical protein